MDNNDIVSEFFIQQERLELLFKMNIGASIVIINKKNRWLGQAHLEENEIYINMFHCSKIPDGDLIETIIHEICHLVNWKKYKSHIHDDNWKYFMICAGIRPEVTYKKSA